MWSNLSTPTELLTIEDLVISSMWEIAALVKSSCPDNNRELMMYIHSRLAYVNFSDLRSNIPEGKWFLRI